MSAVGAALLAAGVALAGCKTKGTYVHVKILAAAGVEPDKITELDLDANLAGTSHTLTFSEPGGILFPTDVTLTVNSGTGQLALTVIAKNAAGLEVDRATTTLTVAQGTIAEATLQLPGGTPDLQPVEATHDFGAIQDGIGGPPVTLSFKNAGFKISGPITVALGGVGAANWILLNGTCNGSSIPSQGTCTQDVQIKPLTLGALAATLTVTGNPGGSAVTSLTGTGSANPQTLTVNLSGNGKGTVTTNPAGLSCTTASCNHAFDWGTSLQLTATPSTGSHFTGWTGACSGTGACTVTTDAAKTVGAAFTLNSETLTVAVTGNGTVNSVDMAINCTSAGGASCTSTYNFGTTVTLNATPGTGSHFVQWSDPACGTVTPCTLTMSAAKSITATFATNLQTVTVTLSGTGGGTVTSAETPTPKLSCTWASGSQSSTGCVASYNFGDQFTVTATPDGSSSQGAGSITGAISVCNGPTCTVTVGDNPITASVTFDHNPVPVSVTLSGNGTGTVTDAATGFSCSISGGAVTGPCTDNVTYGATNVTLTATPTGSAVTWGAGCTPSGNTCTIPGPINGPASVTATFTKTFSVSVTVDPTSTGTGSVSDNLSTHVISNCSASGGTCSGNYVAGSTIQLVASLGATTRPVWGGDCASAGGAGNCQLSITQARNVTIKLIQTFTLTMATAPAGSGSISLSPAGTSCGANCTVYDTGTSVQLTANPSAGNGFTNWTGDCSGQGNPCTLAMSANRSTTANFIPVFTISVVRPSVSGSTVTSTPAGISCTSSLATTCTASFDSGSTVTIVESTNSSARFNGWGQDCATFANGTTCTFSGLSGAKNVTANFVTIFPLTVSPTGSGTGSVSANSGSINSCTGGGGTCTGTYDSGASVILTATPDSVSRVDFSGDCTAIGGVNTPTSCTLTMSQARNVTVTFTKTFLLSVTKSGPLNDNVSVVGVSTCGPTCSSFGTRLDSGASVTLQARPINGTGVLFRAWTSSPCGVSTFHDCAFTMNADQSVTAFFVTQPANTVFVSSTAFPPNLGSARAYDGQCNKLASVAGINNADAPNGTAFVAWIGDASSTPTTQLNTLPARGFLRLDGSPFADQVTDITTTNRIWYPINMDETGATVPKGDQAWTGMNANGTARTGQNCTNWTGVGDSGPITGDSWAGPSDWTLWNSYTPTICNITPATLFHVFCIEKDKSAIVTGGGSTGKLIFLSPPYSIPPTGGGLPSANAFCTTSRPTGSSSTFNALLATTTASAVVNAGIPTGSLVVSYVTKDGVFIGTGAQIASGSISTGPWQRADGSYPSSFVGTWGGATLPNQKAASPADTCSDWTSNSSAATGRFGAGNNQDYFFSFFTNARACSDPNTALFCVEQ